MGYDCPRCLTWQQSRASDHLGCQNRCIYCDCQGNHCGTAHMCRDVQMHIFEDPPFRGALGCPQLQSRLARCIWRRPSEMPRVPLDGNCAGRPMTLVSWRPMASRPRISCKREQSRPLAHVALSPPPKQIPLGTRSLFSRKSADFCANLIFCSGPSRRCRGTHGEAAKNRRRCPPWSLKWTPIRKPLWQRSDLSSPIDMLSTAAHPGPTAPEFYFFRCSTHLSRGDECHGFK